MEKGREWQIRRRLEEMLHELRAINAWNEAHVDKSEHDFIDISGHEARRHRTSELLQEFIELTARCSN